MIMRIISAAALTALLAGSAGAEEQVYRLSDAERAATLAAASHRAESPALLPSRDLSDLNGPSLYGDGTKRDRQVHGEVGMTVGTGGTRGFFGTAVVPLSDNATATLSFSQGQGRGFGYGGYGVGYSAYDYFPYGYPPYGSSLNRRFVR
jgi:hypothetical protein